MNRRKQAGYTQKEKNSALGKHRYYGRIYPFILKLKTLCAKTGRSFQTVDWKRLGLDRATINGDSVGKTLWIDTGVTPLKKLSDLSM
jgi:hypothetical protein